MKKFSYKQYKDCYFIVSTYAANKCALAISIENGKEDIGSTYKISIYVQKSKHSWKMR